VKDSLVSWRHTTQMCGIPRRLSSAVCPVRFGAGGVEHVLEGRAGVKGEPA
jgi:hypothetical protein